MPINLDSYTLPISYRLPNFTDLSNSVSTDITDLDLSSTKIDQKENEIQSIAFLAEYFVLQE